MVRAFLLAGLLIASTSILAGEYGLGVGPSYPDPCERDLSHSLNYCRTAVVMEDLRGHFLSGKPFRIKAVEMAVLTGTIFIDPEAQPAFNDTIAAIVVAESPHDFARLEKFLGRLPYRSLRKRLQAELERPQKPAARARLRKALAALSR